jgi:hypothetical protein
MSYKKYINEHHVEVSNSSKIIIFATNFLGEKWETMEQVGC